MDVWSWNRGLHYSLMYMICFNKLMNKFIDGVRASAFSSLDNPYPLKQIRGLFTLSRLLCKNLRNFILFKINFRAFWNDDFFVHFLTHIITT